MPPSRFVSFAQNWEDVVLWRALGHIERGTYVDVGADDPLTDSVSAAFFHRGWFGIHVASTPTLAAKLRSARPGDVVIENEKALDPLLNGVVLAQPIHFMKVDASGLELVLGANLGQWRPWILVIDTGEPDTTNQGDQQWEHALEQADYSFCFADGLSRFYVHETHPELRESLPHRAGFSDAVIRWRDRESLLPQAAEIKRLGYEIGRAAERLTRAEESTSLAVAELTQLRGQFHDLTEQLADRVSDLAALHATLSWRVTRPLRAVRRFARRGRGQPVAIDLSADAVGAVLESYNVEQSSPMSTDDVQVDLPTATDRAELYAAFTRRLEQAAGLLSPGINFGEMDGVGAFEQAASQTAESALTISWLGFVAATGRYPDELLLASCAQRFDKHNPRELILRLTDFFESDFANGLCTVAELDVVTGLAVIDVTDTARQDVHTGIQRVVREIGERWLTQPSAVGVWWDGVRGTLRRLGDTETDRFRNWRAHLSDVPGSEVSVRSLDHCPKDVVVPWRSTLVALDLLGEADRTGAYRALARTRTLVDLSMIGYDLIPLTSGEAVHEGMSRHFALFLSVAKYATRISAISESSAIEFRAFGGALAAQGLPQPQVVGQPLTSCPEPVTEADLKAISETLDLGSLPLVLVVGSHEPRKNHLAVLAAADQLWAEGFEFKLIFVGGSGWGGEIDREVDRLQALQRPVSTRKRATERELWAAYRLARFSVFPSLVEGFGLPIVESLACGTPVITSNYGSMAETAAGGGALMIDPRDPQALAGAMRLLLTDDAYLEQLIEEAMKREWPTWDEYASRVWRFLVPMCEFVEPQSSPKAWMTIEDADLVEAILQRQSTRRDHRLNVLEWGSGRSTAWYSRYLQSLETEFRWVSIEQDRAFVRNALASSMATGVSDFDIVELGDPAVAVAEVVAPVPGRATIYSFAGGELWPHLPGYQDLNVDLTGYIELPSVIDVKFDVIMVDGRMRRRCLIAATSLAAEGAVVLLHDAERPHYHSAFVHYPAWAFLGAQLWIGARARTDIEAVLPPGARVRFGSYGSGDGAASLLPMSPS